MSNNGEGFKATVRENVQTGQKYLTIPRSVRHRYKAGNEYIVNLQEVLEADRASE